MADECFDDIVCSNDNLSYDAIKSQPDEVNSSHYSNCWKSWQSLGSPKFVVAPMVDRSELPFRMMCRKYGAQLCFSPMFHAAKFVEDPIYRDEMLKTCPEDRPLIIQFCANDADVFAAASKLVESHCDGVDLNLGCPQIIAKRGCYGSYLQDSWSQIFNIVRAASLSVSIPVSCKL